MRTVGHSVDHSACLQLTDSRDCVDAVTLFRVYTVGHSVNHSACVQLTDLWDLNMIAQTTLHDYNLITLDVLCLSLMSLVPRTGAGKQCWSTHRRLVPVAVITPSLHGLVQQHTHNLSSPHYFFIKGWSPSPSRRISSLGHPPAGQPLTLVPVIICSCSSYTKLVWEE